MLVSFEMLWTLFLWVHLFLAAADGVVTQINDDFNIGGPDASYWFYTDFITILHSNTEFSRYDHLGYKSSKVKLNQNVHSDEEIIKLE